LWQVVPELARVQWAHDPERALSTLDELDNVLVRICSTLISVLERD
jgi:hypothetical protein